jgi:hypothetical protein
MVRGGEEDVIGDASGGGATGDGGEGEKRCERPVGPYVEINVDATVVVEEEVT